GERPERLRLRVEPTEFHRQGRRAATVEVLRDLLPGVRVVPPRRRHADLWLVRDLPRRPPFEPQTKRPLFEVLSLLAVRPPTFRSFDSRREVVGHGFSRARRLFAPKSASSQRNRCRERGGSHPHDGFAPSTGCRRSGSGRGLLLLDWFPALRLELALGDPTLPSASVPAREAIDRAPRGTFMHRPGRRLGLSRFEGAPPQARRLWWLNITLPLEIGSGEKARIG